jgi:hypothetical protein
MGGVLKALVRWGFHRARLTIYAGAESIRACHFMGGEGQLRRMCKGKQGGYSPEGVECFHKSRGLGFRSGRG